jgi:hypothetical protein
MRSAPRADRAAVSLVIAVATALALVWAVRVPLFQEPDELAHIDYALELHAVGKPFYVPNATEVRVYSPVLRYLEAATNFRANRYNPAGKLPQNYGTPAFERAIDARAPPLDARVPAPGSGMPYVMFTYPAGYYVVVAAAMALASAVHPHSLVTLMLAARLTSVACLPPTLILAYGIFVRLRLRRATALLCTVAVAWLPLTSWVYGYVQPDDLTTLLLTASLYAAVRWKAEPQGTAWPIVLSTTLVALAFVKEHYAVATIAATFGASLSVVRPPKRWRRLPAVFVPPLCALLAAHRLVPVPALDAPHFAGIHAGPALSFGRTVADAIGYAASGLRDTYAGGGAFTDFWMRFGMRGASIYAGQLGIVLRSMLVAVTLVTVLAVVLRTVIVAKRLVAVAQGRSPWLAVRLLASDVVLNVYLLVTATVFGAYIVSRGAVWLEGRYWLPIIVPTIALGTTLVPRLFRRSRPAVALGFAGLWAVYASVSAPLALRALDRSFYHQPPDRATVEAYAQITGVAVARPCKATPQEVAIVRGCELLVTGFAVDSERGLPATEVLVQVDGGPNVRARTALPSLLLRDVYIDDALADSGFSATLDTRRYGDGPHSLRLRIVERRAPGGLLSQSSVSFAIRGTGRSCAAPCNVAPRHGI